MSEEQNAPLNRGREAVGPQIEDEILELLDGEMRETALGFVAYLNESQLTPRPWFGPNYWRIPYEAYYLCGVVIHKGRWRIWFFAGDYGGALSEGAISAIHASVKPCVSCAGGDCPKGKDTVIFGKAFADTCFQFPIQIENPDSGAMNHIKELIEYWKQVAPYSDSWHCR